MKFIKTYEEACKKQGIDPEKNLPYKNPKNGSQKALNALARLFVIIPVLNMQANKNKEWTPNWTDGNWKYYPWIDMSSGSGLSYGGCGNVGSGSIVGSRLCFINREVAKYCFETFKSDYEDFMLIR